MTCSLPPQGVSVLVMFFNLTFAAQYPEQGLGNYLVISETVTVFCVVLWEKIEFLTCS